MGTTGTLADLRTIATYQFGELAGEALFPPTASLSIERSKSGRPRQIVGESGRLASLTTTGRFTLGLAGGEVLHDAIDGYRVAVGDESEPYVRDGRNVFAKFVTSVDSAIRPGDEVLVVHRDGGLLAVGRAQLSATGMRDFDRGVAVAVREGAGSTE